MVKGNKINGKKKNCRDIVTGADYSKQCGKYVEKIRDINRTDNKYTEIVRDYETGEIIHFCNEKLSAHTGHGSAKLKNSKKQICWVGVFLTFFMLLTRRILF